MSKAPNYYLKERIYENSDKSITIFKTRKRQAISYMAVKVYNKKRHCDNYNYEYQILKNISCSSIINVLGFSEDYSNYYLEMEFCASGDLSKCLWPNKSSSYFEKVLRTVSTQLLLGLQSLHLNGVIHCNLKPSNILIDEFGNVKICDFKKALRMNEMTISEVKKNKQAMTPCYTAPELFGDEGSYSYKTDLWALGCIMYEMAVGQVPFFDEVVNKLIGKILNEEVNFNKKQLTLYSNEFMDVLKKLLEKDPLTRASWGEIEKMPFWDLPNRDESYSSSITYTNTTQIPSASSFKSMSPVDKQTNIIINSDEQEDYSNEKDCQGVDNTDKEFRFQNNEKLIPEDESSYFTIKTNPNQRGSYNDNPSIANHNLLEVSVLNVSKIMQKDKRAVKEEINDLAYSLANNNDLPQIENIMMHNSDRIIKPIIGNQTIEAVSYPTFISSKLPFPIWKIDKIKLLVINGDTVRLENYLLNAYQVMEQYEKKSNEDGLLNLLAYFESIILSKEVANNLINTSFVNKFIAYLDLPNDDIRIRACSIIGFLIRYATTMDKPLDKYSLCDKLISFISDNNAELSRKAIATLGEYLFFVSTQAEGDDSELNTWTVTRESLMALLYALNHTDGIVRFYSLKTIENICILTTISKVFFASNEDFIMKIIEIYNSSSEIAEIKSSALSTISQIIRHEPTLVNVFMNQINSLSALIKSETPKNQQYLINVVLFAIAGNSTTIQYLDLDSLITSLIPLLEFGNDILKKKVILFLSLTLNDILFIDKYGEKLFTLLQKLRIEKDKFYSFVKVFESFMINYCRGFTKAFLSTKSKDTIINYLKAFSKIGWYHKVSYCLFNYDLLDRLVLVVDSCNDDEVSRLAFNVLLTFSENSFSVDENCDLIIKKLFVSILNLTLKMSVDNKRFPLNICANILTVLLDDEKLYSSTILEEGKTKHINNLIITILPFISDLLKSEDTVIASLSFLSLIIERNSAFIRFYRSVGIIDYIFHLLSDPNFYSNLNLIKILIKLIESNDTSFEDIIDMKLIDKLNFLISKDSEEVSNYTEFVIEMLFDLMFKINEHKKKKYANKYDKDDYKKNFTSKIESVAVNFKLCVKLLGSDNLNIQEKSCVILIFMLQLFPETFVQSIGIWVKFSAEDVPNLLKGLDSNCKKIHKRMIRIFRWIIEFQDDAAVILKPYVSYVQIYVEKIKDTSTDAEVVSLASKFLANDLIKINGA